MKELLNKINAKWYYVFADLISKGSLFLIIFLFSYLVIPDDYGNLSLFNSLVTLFFVIVSMNLTNNFITRKKGDKESNLEEIISTIVSFLFILNIIFFITGFILYQNINQVYSISTKLIFWSLLTAIFTCYFDLLQTLFVVHYKKIQYFITSVLYSFSLVIFSFATIFIFPKLGIYSIVFSRFALLFLFTICSIIFLKKHFHLKLQIKKNILKEALLFSTPLIYIV